VSPATLRERAARLETIDRQRDPSAWSSPALNGEVTFTYERAPAKRYSLGNGELKTVLNVSSHNVDSVYVLNDPAEVHAVGVNTARTSTHSELATQLSPGRAVVARVGDQVIIMNTHGALCLVDILEVQHASSEPGATAVPSVRFRYEVLTSS